MSHLWTGAQPRNTSNGDYGRFHFASNQTSGGHAHPANYSTDGNRMTHHAHYPNCQNGHSNMENFQGQNQMAVSKNGQGMPDYTIEYGEDAVRAALGGNMPDFQAQFQKQYGGGNGGVTVDPQAIQMMNNGKSKVAMIPVVFANDEGNDDYQSKANQDSFGQEGSESNKAAELMNDSGNTSGRASQDFSAENQPVVSIASSTQPSHQSKKPPQGNITNAYNSVRRARSVGNVKCGRHVRPSYWNPQVPNPCRKKMDGGGDFQLPNQDQGQLSQSSVALPPNMMSSAGDTASMTMADACNYNLQPMNPSEQFQGVMPPLQRTRSVQPKKHIRPTRSLCGKCQKCKNLSSDNAETPTMVFPNYSPGTRRGLDHHMLTSSSNLGQSAKNFRAIRFSSNNM